METRSPRAKLNIKSLHKLMMMEEFLLDAFKRYKTNDKYLVIVEQILVEKLGVPEHYIAWRIIFRLPEFLGLFLLEDMHNLTRTCRALVSGPIVNYWPGTRHKCAGTTHIFLCLEGTSTGSAVQ